MINKSRDDIACTIVDIDKVLLSTGLESAIDLRYFYSSRALYTIDFYKEYSKHVNPYILSVIYHIVCKTSSVAAFESTELKSRLVTGSAPFPPKLTLYSIVVSV